jgi:hypothetical protein
VEFLTAREVSVARWKRCSSGAVVTPPRRALESALDLAGDLVFADSDRVEPRSDGEQVLRDVVAVGEVDGVADPAKDSADRSAILSIAASIAGSGEGSR